MLNNAMLEPNRVIIHKKEIEIRYPNNDANYSHPGPFFTVSTTWFIWKGFRTRK